MDKPVTLALLTRHGKAAAVAGPLAEAGFAVHTVDDWDTDQLGTFTGEVPRPASQLEVAFMKARKAAELSGCRYGLGSEGSFGPDPFVSMSPWYVELLAWWDAQSQYGVQAVV
jgi:hypothetical protein